MSRYSLVMTSGLPPDEEIIVTKSGKYEIHDAGGRDSSQIVRYTNRNYTHQENDLEFKR